MSTDFDTVISEKTKKKTREPVRYKVLFLNDNFTPIDWVIDLLMSVFKHSETAAKDLTMQVHNEGSAVVAIYSYEIAEQKTIQSISASRERGFPLQVTLEEE